ncbi:SsgA family sporulation/cell division regulator [Kitasatospora sp. NPDC096147]|uniref:SsgA family sporulation/cell division regulator n=1 Tax=Kitasatospora sp. NPDC096147 TaxID=3364093 RepID=UPI00382C8620
MDTAKTVAHRLAVRMLNSAHPDLSLSARLVYDAAAPYAVELHVLEVRPYPEDEPPVCWTFGRELLDRGRHVPSGLGDVLVAPGPGGTVLIELRGTGGTAVLGMPGGQVDDFLADSHSLVPPGEEGRHLDLEGCLARLLV